jgi:Zn-dependent M28 family amino/carboxypeptidase
VQVQPFTWAGLPDVELANLEAVLGGPTDQPGGPVLLVCAHYDTVAWSPGADDDGSGVAVVLEVARRLAGRDLPTEVRALLVDGEERGLVGSRHYVQSLSEDERSRLVGVINLESVGYADRRPGQQTMPAFTEALLDPGDVGDFVLVLANQASAELAAPVLAALASSARGDLRVVGYDRLAGEGWLVPDSRRSDHASFWDAGIPAVMLTDTAPFRNPHYHRPSDRVETLDGPFLAAVARGVERALLILAEDHSEAGP